MGIVATVTKRLITCKGRWIEGQVKCSFSHYGNFGDEILKKHEALEESLNTKNDNWMGFEELKVFKV